MSLSEGLRRGAPEQSKKSRRRETMRTLLLLSILRKSFVPFIVVACSMGFTNKPEVDVVRDATAGIKAKPTVVYVMDFDLDVGKIKLDPRRAKEERGSGLLKEVRHSLGLSKTPQEEANELIDLMAKSIVEGLTKSGLETHRIPSGAPLPSEGWLVRGSFLQVDEGNRLRRAFGSAGQTDLQVAVTVDDLAANARPAPLLQLNTDTDAKSRDSKSPDGKSMKSPGAMDGNHLDGNHHLGGKHLAAGRTSLYAIAVKYVLAGYDLDRNAKETGAKIAEQVVDRARGIEPRPPQRH
jgi:hypothetical protein